MRRERAQQVVIFRQRQVAQAQLIHQRAARVAAVEKTRGVHTKAAIRPICGSRGL